VRALYSMGGAVPAGRVVREHRAALLPLAVILAINIVALFAVVLPLSQRAAGAEQRAVAAERNESVAEADFKRAETLQVAKSRATEELTTFYTGVLPSDVGAARRILQLKLRQQAAAHGVEFQGSGSSEEEVRDSQLLRLTIAMRLSGSYNDIRGFIYDLETSPEFVVIDQISLSEANRTSGLELAMDVSTYYRNPRAAVGRSGDGR
jgi:Tfp pilus assembly protein PilO